MMSHLLRTGAKGALLDEYLGAIRDLEAVLATIPDRTLTKVADENTDDENCRSIQTVLSHVVHAGYGYATSIYNLNGPALVRPEKQFHNTVESYLKDLADMFAFTEKVFGHFEDDELERNDNNVKIMTGWGQIYDIEQLTEHAIVHILRHRRQIERFVKEIQSENRS